MALYICITLFLLLSLFISLSSCSVGYNLQAKRRFYFSKQIINFLFFALIFLFWFLTAFRGDSIGNDTRPYIGYYKVIANGGINPNFDIELGYQYFCLFLSKISPDPLFLLIVCATICYSICGIYIYKHSDNILFSVILLFCVAFSFFASGIRQAIAMCIVLIAYSKIRDGKKILPIILILLASLFHISALMAFLWFAHKFIPKNPKIIIPFGLIIALLAASGSINSFLANILEEYQSYFESVNAGTGWLGIFYYALRALVFYIFAYIAYKKDNDTYSLTTANTVLLLFTVCLGFAVNLFNRASLYFLLPTVVDLPNLFNSGKIKSRDIWMLGAGVVMLAYFVVTLIVRPEWNNLYPYEFYWS